MYKNLFKPIKLIGGIELKNRIVFTSIGIDSYNDDGTVTDENMSFVKARSIETAMIITTVSMATYRYGKVKFIGSYDDSFIPSLSRFAEAGHYGGAKIVLQISAMGGPNTLADDVFHDIVPYVPTSDIPMYKSEWTGKNTPTELTTSQVQEIIEDFVQAARRARDAGFDGVELFAAEDFLLSSFITPHLNRRTDRYGGSFENRLNMPVEIIKGIRKICGNAFIIGFKYNTYYEFPEGDGINLSMGIKIGQAISDQGISYLHEYSYAKHDRPFSLFKYSIMPSQYQPRNTTVPLSEELKKNITDTPVMAVGGILKPDEADRIIGDGKADLVSIGRAFIADHLWAQKAKKGQLIRPCIRCFVCLDEATKSRIIGCSVNPDVLVESSKELKKTNKPRKIAVIGAGPAGMTAALTSSKRGHIVTLYEKSDRLGGQLKASATGGLKYEYLDLLKYYEKELKKSNVKIVMGREINNSTVSRTRPDILIIAIGAKNRIPEIKGIEQGNVLDVSNSIINSNKIKNKKIAIIGGSSTGCEAAVILNRNDNFVTIIEENERLMAEDDIEYLTMVLERILVEEGVRFLTSSRVQKISREKIIVENVKNKNTYDLDADIIVNATGFIVPEDKISLLKKSCRESYVVGDCKKPAKIFQAVSEAFNVSLNI